VTIPAGTLVLANTAAANRDPRRTGPAPWKTITGITGPISLPIEFDTEH
jgi:hypothetical protein